MNGRNAKGVLAGAVNVHDVTAFPKSASERLLEHGRVRLVESKPPGPCESHMTSPSTIMWTGRNSCIQLSM